MAIAAAQQQQQQQDPRLGVAPGVPSSSAGAQVAVPAADGTMTAANLIDAIINNSLNAGPTDKPPVGGGGGFPRRSPAEIAASTPQEDAVKAAAYKKQLAESAAAAVAAAAAQGGVASAASNGPEDLRPPSNPGSRPGSRPSSSLVIEQASAVNDKGPSPAPENMSSDPYWRKRAAYAAANPGPPNTAMQAPRPAEERQITRAVSYTHLTLPTTPYV